jgi:hypothetical protein
LIERLKSQLKSSSVFCSESGCFQAAGNLSFLPHGQFVGQHKLQELRVIQSIGRGFLQAHFQRLGHAAQPQLLQTFSQLRIHRGRSLRN